MHAVCKAERIYLQHCQARSPNHGDRHSLEPLKGTAVKGAARLVKALPG